MFFPCFCPKFHLKTYPSNLYTFCRQAFHYVQQRRFCINPNEGFAQQLSEYEPIYKARLTLEKGQPSRDKGLID